MTRRVLITGASGFIARALVSVQSTGFDFVAVSRHPLRFDRIEWRQSPHLSGSADWKPALDGIDAVVHLAGRAHLAPDGNPSAYFAENCDGTSKLAQDAIASGVKRFVFLSSAKVLGDESGAMPLTEAALPRPSDPYAASKIAAEQALARLGDSMQVTILRPPLVYGPGVKANFHSLLAAIARGLPLPLASIRNRRSFLGVDNLAAAIVACLDSPNAAGRTFHVTDGPPLSTPDLVREIALALGKPSRMFAFPPGMLEACGAVIGRGETVKRLTRSLELDSSAIQAALGWRAVRTFQAGIADTVRWYRSLD